MELLISMALFIVVVTMGIGALLVLISANLKAQNIQESVSNLQFALDSMTREIRTGYSYYCSSGVETVGDIGTTQDCNKGTYLSIIEGGKSLTEGDDNRRIAYRYNASDDSIERKIGTGPWVRLTNANVAVTSMYFNVNNTTPFEDANSAQPNVTIYISGVVSGVDDSDSTFELQTTVTQRTLDL